MKTPSCRWTGALAIALAGTFLNAGLDLTFSQPSIPLANRFGTNEDFSAVHKAVFDLLKTRDANAFAATMAPRSQDWASIYSTNNSVHDPNALAGFRSGVEREREKIAQSARDLIARADSLHLSFSNTVLNSIILPPTFLGTICYSTLQAPGSTLRFAQKVEILFNAASIATLSRTNAFSVTVLGLARFPEGWRSSQGVEWSGFPPGVADAKTLRELGLLKKASDNGGITDREDPALIDLGNACIGFLKSGDVPANEAGLLAGADQMWAGNQRMNGNRANRSAFDSYYTRMRSEVHESLMSTLQQMKDAGVDLSTAQINVVGVSVKQLYARSGPGTIEGLEAALVQIRFAVNSDGKSKTGQSLTGNYALALKEIYRLGGEWKLAGPARWSEFPVGVVDDKTAASIKLENYVAENWALPPGTSAPDIEWVCLTDGRKMKLSQLRGKVVILDFWATWCGPCQEPMATLQTLRLNHLDWQDRVAIVPISIDDTLQEVQKHVAQRGWTNTFNVWAGDGAWASAPAKTFRVSAVPTTYIIDASGLIVHAGHPAGMQFDEIIGPLLRQPKSNKRLSSD